MHQFTDFYATQIIIKIDNFLLFDKNKPRFLHFQPKSDQSFFGTEEVSEVFRQF